MHLIFVTRALDRNHPSLAFACDWVEALAGAFEGVTVLAMRVASAAVHPRVTVVPLGDGHVTSRVGRYARLAHSLATAARDLAEPVCLVHMIPFHAIVAAPIVRLRRMPLALWYALGSTPFPLPVAVRLVNLIFTPSLESLRVRSAKVRVVGHGIDTRRFAFVRQKDSRPLIVLSVGRMSRSKGFDDVMRATALARDALGPRGRIRLQLAGAPQLPDDHLHLRRLKDQERRQGVEVEFLGSIPYADMPAVYGHAHVYLSMSRTGSVDKAVLEAMATGLPSIVPAPVFGSLLGPELGWLGVDPDDPQEASRAVIRLADMQVGERIEIGRRLRERVVADHDLQQLAQRLRAEFECHLERIRR